MRSVTGRKRMRIPLNMLPPLEQKFQVSEDLTGFQFELEGLDFSRHLGANVIGATNSFKLHGNVFLLTRRCRGFI